MRSRRVRRRTYARRKFKRHMRRRKRTKKRRGGSDYKRLETQTVREKNEQLQTELRACMKHRRALTLILDAKSDERLQYENNALYQEKMDAEFHAYNAIVLKELYAQELVKAGIPLPEA